jgi:hypothetical protein
MEKSASIPGKPLFSKRGGLGFIFIITILLAADTVFGQSRNVADYDIEAAFLSNLGKFVEWPQNAFATRNAPIVIGVYGENPFHNSLDGIVHGRIIDGHRVIAQSVSLNTLQSCQVLFICPSERNSLPAIVRRLNHASVLTVTENVDPFQSGAMINFVRENNQIHFEINDVAARRAGLQISSKLLGLAARPKPISRETPKNQDLICARSP